MINRIILIGNGFDLAHGLKTSYKDFLEYYWMCAGEKLKTYAAIGKEIKYEDEFVEMSFTSERHTFSSTLTRKINFISAEDCLSYMQEYCANPVFKYKSDFFKRINQTLRTYNWVDIENEYYQLLKYNLINQNKTEDIQSLNRDLIALKCKLEEYLKLIDISHVPSNNVFWDKIYNPIKYQDLSIKGKEYFNDLIKTRYNLAQGNGDDIINIIFTYPKFLIATEEVEDIKQYTATHSFEELHSDLTGDPLYSSSDSLYFFSIPNNTLFLNFNYTETPNIYTLLKMNVKIIHIHGKLGDPKNPIIFGYGDEMDKSFREILEQNDNAYLENIKSMHYAETDNYRRLLQFIESAPYQIYIMGHSCGNSDRTLLNTLFEHKNCISIKPFYHEWAEEGVKKDDYLDKIQNISRNFNDMALMRDRVVNKTYCEPLG